MTWVISGSRIGTVLAVSDAGIPICRGEGEHEPLPPGMNDYGGNINRLLLSRLQKAKCAWTVALPNEAPIHIDANGQGLLEHVAKAPDKSHGMITFFSDHRSCGYRNYRSRGHLPAYPAPLRDGACPRVATLLVRT